MIKTKLTKSLVLISGCLGLAVVFYLLSGSAKAANEPGNVQFGADYQSKLIDYMDSLSDPGPFTGAESADIKQVYPLFLSPYANYEINFNSPGKQAYQKGEKLSIKGDLNYSFQSPEKVKKIVGDACQAKYKGKQGACQTNPANYQAKLTDLGIFVQVFRKDEDPEGLKNGDYLVDEFYTNLAHDSQEMSGKLPFDLSWTVPTEIKEGKYYLSLSVNSAKRFDLSGTPLLAYQAAKIFDFSVIKDGENGIELDKNNILINNTPYVYRSPSPTVEPLNGEVKIVIPVVNLSSNERTVKIRYEISGWGQEDVAGIIQSGTDTLVIGSSEKSTYEVKVKPEDVSSIQNIRIIAENAGSKSVSNIRFLLKDKNRGNFMYLGLAQSGQEQKSYQPLFGIRNAQYQGYFDGKIKLTVTDKNQQENTWEKSGKINAKDSYFLVNSDSMKFADLDCLKIKGEIFDSQGRLVDQKETSYQCSKSQIIKNNFSDQILSIQKNKKVILALVLLIIAGIAGTLIFVSNKNKQSNEK